MKRQARLIAQIGDYRAVLVFAGDFRRMVIERRDFDSLDGERWTDVETYEESIEGVNQATFQLLMLLDDPPKPQSRLPGVLDMLGIDRDLP